jgi:hypothetical protein
MASNLAFADAIKRKAFEKNNIDNALRTLDAVFIGDASHSPESAAERVLQICNLAEKHHTNIETIRSEVEEKLGLLKTLNKKIDEAEKLLSQIQDEKQKALDDKKLTLRELEDYAKCRRAFEVAGLDFNNWPQTANVLNNLGLMNQDPERIIGKPKTIESFYVREMELSLSCGEKRQVLADFKKKEEEEIMYWNAYYEGNKEFIKLTQTGLSPISILQVHQIIRKHQPYLSVDELAFDIDKYGGIKGAIFSEQTKLNELKNIEYLDDRGPKNQYSNFVK